ncbi:hypothetical protein C2845_PM09G12080 [Panicum miliaceum]|uniref:Uncharacterized protein n=1 Tax=Panicum miliaceum TaxID=4540 RepID=A0A3L6S1E7_PANMI|nr:hypothetical protein C2845_PM09G12080 [Panicum miliaceum]
MSGMLSSSATGSRCRLRPDLPLLPCPDCGCHTIVERVVKTDGNGNKGRIFFRCPGGRVRVRVRMGLFG